MCKAISTGGPPLPECYHTEVGATRGDVAPDTSAAEGDSGESQWTGPRIVIGW